VRLALKNSFGSVSHFIYRGGVMRVLGMCFLALLLFLTLPVSAQEYDYNEPESGEETEEETGEENEEVAEEAAKEVEEEPFQEEKDVAEEKVTPAPEPKPDVTVAVEVAGEEKEEEAEKKDDKKFGLSITNGFNHGFAKERKNFGYNLNLGLSYALPWKLNFAAGVGLRVQYKYDMLSAAAQEDGMIPTERVDYAVFDGTPLSMSLEKGFPLFWDIGGSLSVTLALPFTSTQLWEKNKVYAMLGTNLKLGRPFKVGKETTLTPGFGFAYQKNFAKYRQVWDNSQNMPLYSLNEHDIGLGFNLALAHKSVTFAVGAGYGISKNYGDGPDKDFYGDGDFRETTQYQEWTYGFAFNTSLSYRYKGWNFSGGVATEAPEFDNGNYSGFDTVPGDPSVKSGTYNYPFKARYTRVFANIGYSYSF